MDALAHFGIDAAALVGTGAWSRVYALSDALVLRLFGSAMERGRVEALARFYAGLARDAVAFAVPDLLEIGAVGERLYVIERRIHGVALVARLGELTGARRERALRSHLAAAGAIWRLAPPQDRFGEILTGDEPLRRASWRHFLRDRAAQEVATLRPTLIVDVPGIDRALARFAMMVEALPEPQPSLVHGDYHPGNTLVDAEGLVVGVIDFGPLTLSGDRLLDTVCAISFLGYAKSCRPEDTALLRRLAGDDAALAAGLAVYDAYHAFRFANMKADGPEVYAWCVKTLRALGEQ